jgi:hypothetical protein
MCAVLKQEVRIRIADHYAVQELLQDLRLQVTFLEEQRDFWENEYNELLLAVGGQDPRHE